MKPRPKLMYVLGLQPQKIGGMEKFVHHFARALDAAGWDCVLVFDGPPVAEFVDYIARPGVTLEQLDRQGGFESGTSRELWRLLRKHRPEIFVYAFNGVLRFFPWLARLAGCRRIFFNDHSSRAPGGMPRLSAVKRAVGRILTAPLTAVIAVSEFTRRSGMAFGVTTVPWYTVPNGVEVRAFDPARRAAFRARYGVADNECLVTQMCWMVPVKGVDTMLHAMALARRRCSRLRVLLVGEGPDVGQYEALAVQLRVADVCTFTGLIHNPTDSGVLEGSDLYAQPSIWQEASGLAVLEAMSFSRPVVASDIGGLPENVADERSGLLVPPGDAEALAEALVRLCEEPLLRQAMGAEGLATIEARHRIEQTAARYVEIFLQGKPRS